MVFLLFEDTNVEPEKSIVSTNTHRITYIDVIGPIGRCLYILYSVLGQLLNIHAIFRPSEPKLPVLTVVFKQFSQPK